jgi:hypothetical protein
MAVGTLSLILVYKQRWTLQDKNFDSERDHGNVVDASKEIAIVAIREITQFLVVLLNLEDLLAF